MRSSRTKLSSYLFILYFSSLLLSPVESYALNNTTIASDTVTRILDEFNLNPPAANVCLTCTPYQQNTEYTCGPAAVMTLLHYYGKLAAKDMNISTELRIAAEMGTNPDYGTLPEQMDYWLQTHGFEVKRADKVSVEILEDSLKKGRPILVAIDKHWSLATGFISSEDHNDSIIFTDSCLQSLILKREEINALWLDPLCKQSHQCSRTVGIYLIATPTK